MFLASSVKLRLEVRLSSLDRRMSSNVPVSRRAGSRPQGGEGVFTALHERPTSSPAVTSGRRPRRVKTMLCAGAGCRLHRNPSPLQTHGSRGCSSDPARVDPRRCAACQRQFTAESPEVTEDNVPEGGNDASVSKRGSRPAPRRQVESRVRASLSPTLSQEGKWTAKLRIRKVFVRSP